MRMSMTSSSFARTMARKSSAPGICSWDFGSQTSSWSGWSKMRRARRRWDFLLPLGMFLGWLAFLKCDFTLSMKYSKKNSKCGGKFGDVPAFLTSHASLSFCCWCSLVRQFHWPNLHAGFFLVFSHQRNILGKPLIVTLTLQKKHAAAYSSIYVTKISFFGDFGGNVHVNVKVASCGDRTGPSSVPTKLSTPRRAKVWWTFGVRTSKGRPWTTWDDLGPNAIDLLGMYHPPTRMYCWRSCDDFHVELEVINWCPTSCGWDSLPQCRNRRNSTSYVWHSSRFQA